MIKFVLLFLCVFLAAASNVKNETEAAPFGIRRILKTNSSFSDEDTDGVLSSRRNLGSIPYEIFHDHDRHHGNIGHCGRYSSHQQIRDACTRDSRCVGYTLFKTRPWCLKTSSSGRLWPLGYHTYYQKGGKWLTHSNGKYYINLNGENFSQYMSTKTVFNKVQLLSAPRKGDRTVKVNINNVDFAQTSNPGQNGHKLKFMPWGRATDCRWGFTDYYRSPLSIDLSGTPFALRGDYPAHNPAGFMYHGKVTCSSDKKCTGRCGGFCGFCGADDKVPLILYVEDQAYFDRYAY
jgi:hypothetical protein